MEQQKSSISLSDIVIVGGGFGGLAAARVLGDAPVRIRRRRPRINAAVVRA